jgi:hypothetical protein
LKQKWVSGSFKEIESQPKRKGDILQFDFLDNNQRILKKLVVEHPLKTSYEAFFPDGTIERKQISLKEAEFTIRTNIRKTLTYITVNDTNGQVGLIEL